MSGRVSAIRSAVRKDKAKHIGLLMKSKAKNERKMLAATDARYKRVCRRLDGVL